MSCTYMHIVFLNREHKVNKVLLDYKASKEYL